jgi:hypothetical protein
VSEDKSAIQPKEKVNRMYQISRAIYRELAPYVGDPEQHERPEGSASKAALKRSLLRSCEAVIERLARDPYCFADPVRTLFSDIRPYFPMSEQRRVHRVVSAYLAIAERHIAEHPLESYVAVTGEPPRCRATTRKGEACRRLPLPHNGYCPSHQHLAETEDGELPLARLREKAEAILAGLASEGPGEPTLPGARLEREHEREHERFAAQGAQDAELLAA